MFFGRIYTQLVKIRNILLQVAPLSIVIVHRSLWERECVGGRGRELALCWRSYRRPQSSAVFLIADLLVKNDSPLFCLFFCILLLWKWMKLLILIVSALKISKSPVGSFIGFLLLPLRGPPTGGAAVTLFMSPRDKEPSTTPVVIVVRQHIQVVEFVLWSSYDGLFLYVMWPHLFFWRMGGGGGVSLLNATSDVAGVCLPLD